MSVAYSLAKMGNPQDQNAPKKFYAKAQATGRHDLNTICDSVSRAGTAIRGDVLAVSDGLIYEMQQGLKQGKIVELGDFGHFQVQLENPLHVAPSLPTYTDPLIPIEIGPFIPIETAPLKI